MEPFSLSVLSDLVSNAAAAVIGRAYLKGRALLSVEEDIKSQLDRDPALSDRFRRIAAELTGPLFGHESVELNQFLRSGETAAVLRQLFSGTLANRGGQAVAEGLAEHTARVREAFMLTLRRYVDVQTDDLDRFGGRLFDLLSDACAIAIQIAVDYGHVSAVEQVSAHRHRFLVDSIADLKAYVALLAAPQATPADLDGFEVQLRSEAAARHAYIRPPHLDNVRRVPVHRLYVHPHLQIIGTGERVTVRTVRASLHRTVILGNPGGGKTSFATALCHDAACPGARVVAGRSLTPIVVELREFATEARARPQSFAQYIERLLSTRYQLVVPDRALQLLLAQGRLLVVFDGLDELTDTSDRQKVAADIESFCRQQPTTPVLVTSRLVGYQQAPLDPTVFSEYRILDFDELQVEEYVDKWFSVDAEDDPERSKQKQAAFLSESESVRDIRANPLMLALMCSLYRAEGYIPENRADLYEKCATLMFERWDKSRGIATKLSLATQVAPVLAHVANWIYTSSDRQAGVTEAEVREQVQLYVSARRRVGSEIADIADGFVDYCKGRAWVFCDAGTTRQGVPLYQFSHRTFLEYYAADFVLRNSETNADLWRTLSKRVKEAEWDVVAQIAFQRRDRTSETASRDLVVGVLETARLAKEPARFNCLSFVARCLAFMRPPEAQVVEVVEDVVKWCIENSQKDEPVGKRSFQLLAALLDCPRDTRLMTCRGLEEALTRVLLDGTTSQAESAADITCELTMISQSASAGRPLSGATEDTRATVENILRRTASRLVRLRNRSPIGVEEALMSGALTLTDYIEETGVGALFSSARGRGASIEVPRGESPILRMLTELPHEYHADRPDGRPRLASRVLASFGQELLAQPLPFLVTVPSARGNVEGMLLEWRATAHTWKTLPDWTRFGALCALGALLEVYGGRSIHAKLVDSELPSHIKIWLLSRLDGSCELDTVAALGEFSESATEVLVNWGQRNVSFADGRRATSAGSLWSATDSRPLVFERAP